MIFFTSDLHLGHANAIEFTNRPFSSVEEMNKSLIQNINEMVSVEDELWILGDFSYKISSEEVRALRAQISCRHVHLIYGNHDKDYYADHIFQSVQHYKELKTDYGRLVLFHYPILEWSAAHYGSIHLHGHIHSTGAYNEENLKKKYGYRLNSADYKICAKGGIKGNFLDRSRCRIEATQGNEVLQDGKSRTDHIQGVSDEVCN